MKERKIGPMTYAEYAGSFSAACRYAEQHPEVEAWARCIRHKAWVESTDRWRASGLLVDAWGDRLQRDAKKMFAGHGLVYKHINNCELGVNPAAWSEPWGSRPTDVSLTTWPEGQNDLDEATRWAVIRNTLDAVSVRFGIPREDLSAWASSGMKPQAPPS